MEVGEGEDMREGGRGEWKREKKFGVRKHES